MNPFINDSFDIAARVTQSILMSKTFCSIGYITKVKLPFVDIKPAVNFFDKSQGKFIEFPDLEDIPLASLQGPNYAVKVPVVVGQWGVILWCDREIYTTFLKGGVTTPDSGDYMDTQAAIFIPLLNPAKSYISSAQSGVDIVSGALSLLTLCKSFSDSVGTFSDAFLQLCNTLPPGTQLTSDNFSTPLKTILNSLKSTTSTTSENFSKFKGGQ